MMYEIEKWCRRHGYEYEVEEIKLGFHRAIIRFSEYYALEVAAKQAAKSGKFKVTTKCHDDIDEYVLYLVDRKANNEIDRYNCVVSNLVLVYDNVYHTTRDKKQAEAAQRQYAEEKGYMREYKRFYNITD